MDKRLLILFFCGLFMSLSATAQNSVTVEQPHMVKDAYKVLIKERHQDSLSTITCSNSMVDTLYKATFIYSNGSMQAREVTVDSILVNDMVIENDTVYFCGRNEIRKKAIIGYFSISGVFFGSAPIMINSDFEAGEAGYKITDLTRIVCFCRDYIPPMHVACIGTCKGDNDYPCLIDMTVNPSSSYVAGCVENQYESFTDIKRIWMGYGVEEYCFVTAGYNWEYGRYINIRMYKESNFFHSSGLQDMCHVYCIEPNNCRPWLDGGVLLEGITANTIATVSYRYNDYIYDDSPRALPQPTAIHIGYYDPHLILNNSVYGMLNNYEIQIVSTDEREMNQFIYNGKTKSLAFLHTYKTNYGNVHVSEYSDFKYPSMVSSGLIQAYLNYDVIQSGLSLFYNNDKYILSGYDLTAPTTLFYQMNTFDLQSKCAHPFNYRYRNYNKVESWNYKKPFSKKYGEPLKVIVEVDKEYLPLFRICNDK